MRGLEIDAEAQIARAEAGVIWEEVSLAAARHGLAGLAGSSPDVGVVGYTLGGGLGWLARRYGLAANSVVAVEIVTADGRQVARRRRARPRPLLGDPRRRRELRHRHRDRVRPLPRPRGLRRRALLSLRARGRDPQGLAPLGGRHARRGHLRRPPDAVPALPAGAGARPRQVVRDRRGHVHGLRRGRRRADAAAPRARPGHGHLCDDPCRGAPLPAHGSARARARRRRRDEPRRRHAGDHRRARCGRRPRLRLAAPFGRVPPARRRGRSRRARPRRRGLDRRRLRFLRRRHGRHARDAGRRRGACRGRQGRPRPLGGRAPLLQLRRPPAGRASPSTRRTPTAACSG